MNMVNSDKAAEPLGPYSHARKAGGLLFLSGIGPRQRGTRDIPGTVLDAADNVITYSIEAELRSCFQSVSAILQAAGGSWADIVDVQVFLTDMKRDWKEYNRVYAEFFPGPELPTRTTVEVSKLPTGGRSPIHVEVKVVAVARDA